MIAHESRRLYGAAQRWKIAKLLPKAQSALKRKRQEHSDKVKASQQKAKKAKASKSSSSGSATSSKKKG